MPTHGGDDLNDGRLSQSQAQLLLVAALSGLSTLSFAIVHLCEGRPQFAHQLLEALITHWNMWPSVIVLDGLSDARLLVCEWHRGGYL